MKIFIKSFSAALLSLSVALMGACTPSFDRGNVRYVDPYIGAGYHGHVFVGANVPNGMVQAGPQNINKGWDWCSGYHYSDSVIIGFTHTHLSGTGCADLGDVLVMPYTGTLRSLRGEQHDITNTCASYYKHENEQVAPGYYSLLMDNGVFDEMTTTERVALHHVIYPEESGHRLMINLLDGNAGDCVASYLKRLDDYTIEGYRYTRGWSPHRKVFFVLKTSKKIGSFDVFHIDTPAGKDEVEGNAKGVITFAGNPKEVSFKVALSSVSCENARLNLDTEMPGWDFNEVRSAAVDSWNKVLSRVEVETDNESDKVKFYTAIYHMYIAPALYADVDGRFRGHDDKIYEADWKNYSVFSLWDTYRAYHPLMTLFHPEMVPDMINSMLSIYDQQGKLPIWPLSGGETNQMPGYSAVPVIADAYLKGFNGFDKKRAFDYMVSSATNRGQHAVGWVLDHGYIPCDKIIEGTSYNMEYAVGDWGIALVAEQLGLKKIADKFFERGKVYEKYFDHDIQFIRPKMEDGSWRTPYDPMRSIHGVGDFCEGNGWHYTFFNPQNPELMIELMGGDENFSNKLDSLFLVTGSMGEQASMDITGLIGMYAHGNEPSHHVAYLYPYAGKQWKTAEQVKFIQKNFYTDQPDGIIGNEDCGQMSAWHVLSAMGFYQVNPSHGVYVFGTPSFDKLSLKLPGGKKFTVIAHNLSDENFYIQSAKLNGAEYEKSYITYEDIMAGATLEFTMGAEPNKAFGAAPENRPASK